MKRTNLKVGLISLLLGVLLGGMISFGGYKLIISPRNARQAEQQKQRYEAMLSSQRAEDQRLINQNAQKNHKGNDLNQSVLSENPDDKADKLLDTVARARYIGTVLAVKDGKVILNQGLGDAIHEQNVANGPNTQYQIGSIQKSLTAVLIMRLVQQGKLKLSDHIGKFYPQIKTGNQVTIRNMLDMRSGLMLNTTQTKVLSDDAIVKFAINHLNYSKVGTASYSPVNYVILAGVVEKLTKQLYSQQIQDTFVRPLKLIHTGFMPGLLKERDRALGYSGPMTAPYQLIVSWTPVMWNRELGTGNLYATAGDLFLLQQAMVQGKIISSSSMATLRHTDDGRYSGGVYNYKSFFVTHGVIGGHEATVVMRHDGQTAVVLMGNHFSNQVQAKALAQKLYQMIAS